MNYRRATLDDVHLLAAMNKQLIRDEGHRNRMSLDELEKRMREWLEGDYRAVVFEDIDEAAGYALFKHEPEWVYLRQFFVSPPKGRQGVGRQAIGWVLEHEWRHAARIRLEVLVGNSTAIEFWRSLDFFDYCLTMERPNSLPDC